MHFAVNCASIGCPMLREEAYVAERLDAQLEEQARRFLSDRSRNRFNAESGALEVSKIFDWFKEDWASGRAASPAKGSRSSRASSTSRATRNCSPTSLRTRSSFEDAKARSPFSTTTGL